MLPARALKTEPLQVKKSVAQLKHLGAPVKGLSMTSTLSVGDPKTAVHLENVIIEEDKIRCRFGSRLAYTHSAGKPIEAAIPHYGGTDEIVFATDGKLVYANGDVLAAPFTSNDWHWTAFSNLSATEYTVMVNGKDGVFSWDGGNVSVNPPPIVVTSLSKSPTVGANATCTVAAADITKFHDGDVVLIAGATGTGLVNANGYHTIYNVGNPVNSFTLAGVDTSTASGPQTTGVTADPPGTGFIQEIVTAPVWLPHIVPSQFQIVVSHMNRLWFADSSNLSVYYLPLQQKGGTVTELPLNAVFRRGGHVMAMATWTNDGGAGLDDQLVIFSSNGEAVVYSGLDPDSDFNLVGIFRFDSPMSKNCVMNYGGELHVLISTGFVPFSTLIRAEDEQLGKVDQNVYSEFERHSREHRSSPGWSAFLNPNTGRAILNLPMGGANQYHQYVRAMQTPAYTHWSGIPSRCWGWLRGMVYYGTDDGRIYEFDRSYLSDRDKDNNAVPIKIDIQWAWSNYGMAQIKQFKMLLPYITTDGIPRPYLDFRVDYDTKAPFNQPDVTQAGTGATWDLATWDVDNWAGGEKTWQNWQGIAAIGRVGAPRLVASIVNCEFAITGIDVLFEGGSVFG